MIGLAGIGRRIGLAMAGALAFGVVALAPTVATSATSEDEAYVQELADSVIAILNDESKSSSAKSDDIAEIMDENLDVERIAAFTLGKYRRQATDDELDEFTELFHEYIIELYVNRLSEYTGLTFKVVGSTDLGGDKGTIVESTIQTDAPDPLEVNWWVVDSGGGPSIIDVQLEGIWTAQDLRSQFTSVIDQSGGKVQSVIDHLREMVESA